MISKQFIDSAIQFPAPPNEIRINCPECNDTSGHMYCNISKMLYHCFKCGASGRIVDDEYFDLKNYVTATGRVSGREENLSKSPEVKVIKNLPISTLAIESINTLGWSYLEKRGLRLREIESYNLRLGTSKYPFVIFPIYNRNKELVYFVSRRYDEGKPKYINASWPKEDTFYVVDGHGPIVLPIVLCEGVFDALAIGRVGYEAWAILGKECTGKQLMRLKEVDTEFLIYLDDDAFSYAVNLQLQLNSLGIRTRLVTHHKDAADLYLIDKGETLRRLLDEETKHLRKGWESSV